MARSATSSGGPAEERRVIEAAEREGKRRSGDQSWFASLGAAGYLMIVAGAGLAIVLLAVALGSGNWLWLPVAVVVLLAALGGIGYFLIDRTTELEKPSAEAVADLEARGVRNPEGALNDQIEHEQQDKVTPSASDARPVGPGRSD
jgi:hypothetical protein